MRVLVIPDIHLKPQMFRRAAELIVQEKPDRALCLMDIPDDWGKQYNLELYRDTFDAAILFAKEHPDTLWCYGNHDMSYPWNRKETGYSPVAPRIVCDKLEELKSVLPDAGQIAFIHRIGNVLFMHGGLTEAFVRDYVPSGKYHDTDFVLEEINGFGPGQLWQDDSPLWFRPQYRSAKMYKPRTFLQVVGHTPVREIAQEGSVLSCDVFSTDRLGIPYGTQEFPVVDTVSLEWKGVR